jgi:hypothetical protein
MNFIKFIMAKQIKNPFFYAMVVSLIGSGMLFMGNADGFYVFGVAMTFMLGSMLVDIFKWEYETFKRDQQ